MSTQLKEKPSSNLKKYIPALSDYVSLAFNHDQNATMDEMYDIVNRVIPEWLEICKDNPNELLSIQLKAGILGTGNYCPESEIFTVEQGNVHYRFKDNGNKDLTDRQSQEFSKAFTSLLAEECGDKTFGQLLDNSDNASLQEANFIAYNVLMKAIELERFNLDEGGLTIMSRSGTLPIQISNVTSGGFDVLIQHMRLGRCVKINLGSNFPCITNLKAYTVEANDNVSNGFN